LKVSQNFNSRLCARIVAGAMLALLAASATVLGLGQGLRRLVDDEVQER
jgi:hypothetical protein